jgi:hypothetical protein
MVQGRLGSQGVDGVQGEGAGGGEGGDGRVERVEADTTRGCEGRGARGDGGYPGWSPLEDWHRLGVVVSVAVGGRVPWGRIPRGEGVVRVGVEQRVVGGRRGGRGGGGGRCGRSGHRSGHRGLHKVIFWTEMLNHFPCPEAFEVVITADETKKQ